MTPLERILQALREHGKNPRLSGEDWLCCCPAHDDRTPSLSIAEEKPGGKVLVNCFAGCDYRAVLAAIGLKPRDLYPENEDRPTANLSVRSGLKLEDLAAAKKLPADFLRSLGVETTWVRKLSEDDESSVVEVLTEPGDWNALVYKSQWREVLIRYRKEDGSEARPRRRMNISGECKHCWAGTKEDGDIVPYGLDRLKSAREKGFLILVEGESDCWVLWLHGYPALGIPGAKNASTLKREHLDGIERVYLIQEPGEGGETFFDLVRKRLSSWKSWKGKLLRVCKPGDAKDPCDLRMRDPEGFNSAMDEVIAKAESVPLERAAVKTQKPNSEKIKLALDASDIRPLTDFGNAERLIARHGSDLRYCYEMDKWFVWTGKRWAEDRAAALRKAKETVRSIPEEIELADGLSDLSKDERSALKDQLRTHAKNSESRTRIYALLKLAESEKGVQVKASDLDANHWLFNVQNGTVNLRTGELQAHGRTDLITRIANVIFDPAAKAPLWKSFVSDVMAGNREMISYLMRVVGYCLTGEVSEQCLFFLWGTGSNGKSTFTEVIMALLGSLAHKSETNIFTTTRNSNDGGRATPELSRLRGRRLVVTSELDVGKRVDEARVKDLTGSDTIVARGLFQDFIEFQPTHKLFVFGNHKPTVRGGDHGIWRRIRLIPFTVCFDDTPDKLDRNLKNKLLNELPGILNWAIAGCLEWQEHGLGLPDCVKKATESYRTEMDMLGQFLRERCVLKNYARVQASLLYKSYCEWADDNGEREVSQKALGMMLQERGFKSIRSRRHRMWEGLGLASADDDFDSENEEINLPKPADSKNETSDLWPKSHDSEQKSPEGDAFVTHCDAFEKQRVTPQPSEKQEVTTEGDACDTFCTHLHTCARTHSARAYI